MVTSLEAIGRGWVRLLVATTVLLAQVDWRGGSLLAKPRTRSQLPCHHFRQVNPIRVLVRSVRTPFRSPLVLAEAWQTSNLIEVCETLFAQDSLRRFSCAARPEDSSLPGFK